MEIPKTQEFTSMLAKQMEKFVSQLNHNIDKEKLVAILPVATDHIAQQLSREMGLEGPTKESSWAKNV